MEVQEEDAEV